MGSQDLQQARYDQLVRRVGGLYGGGSKVVEVLPEVFPVLDLENLPPDLLALAGWRTAMIGVTRAAGVVDGMTTQLFNPEGSNVIAVVTKLLYRISGGTDNVRITTSNTQITGGFTRGLFRDTRFGGNRESALGGLSQIDLAPAATTVLFTDADDLVHFEVSDGIVVLVPGSGLNVGTSVASRQITTNFFWRERLALDSELNFPT